MTTPTAPTVRRCHWWGHRWSSWRRNNRAYVCLGTVNGNAYGRHVRTQTATCRRCGTLRVRLLSGFEL